MDYGIRYATEIMQRIYRQASTVMIESGTQNTLPIGSANV